MIRADQVRDAAAMPIKSRPLPADIPHMDRLRFERGFSLVELVIVTLIIGMLAAFALPSFLGQRAKGQDAAAKSDARSLVTQMEDCYTEHHRYDSCPGPNTGIPRGNGAGQVDLQPPSGDTYVLVARSHSGNTFKVKKNLDGTTTLSCTDTGTTAGGCNGGSW
jgi:type IV pilus assembly protein PilA